MKTSDFVTVATILRSPFHLAYALPLLFVSITLLFAGTFLTLDRTRSFASSSDVKTKPPFCRLESGIGGLTIGWALGAHSTTLVALLILNKTQTAHLGPAVFLLVWLISAIGFTLVCGRWTYVALVSGGLLGGGCTGLLLAISLHPPLMGRYILTVICIVLVLVGVLLPYPVLRHSFLRAGTSAAGAVGIINACAILGSPSDAKLGSWASAWLHLVLPHDSDISELHWDAGKSKGLTAAAFFLWMIGATCDWWLKRRIGEDPDEAWDSVLGSYSASFPPEASRTGIFVPIKSSWARFMDRLRPSSNSELPEKPLLFPKDSDLTRSAPSGRAGVKAPPVFRPRNPGALTPDPYYSDSDSDIGEGENIARRAMMERKWTASTNFSDATLVSPRPKQVRKHRDIGGALEPGFVPPVLTSSPSGTCIEYGDKDAERSPELNMGIHRIEPSRDNDKNWKPLFLKRSDSIRSAKAEMVDSLEGQDVTTAHTSGTRTPTFDHADPASPLQQDAWRYASNVPIATHGLVPATPSLIYAMDRVTRAQRQAYAGGMGSSTEHLPRGSTSSGARPGTSDRIEGLPSSEGRERGWKSFWADVHQQASR